MHFLHDEGACADGDMHARRFRDALTKSMPPFKAWRLPAALGSLLPWQTSGGAAKGSAEANLAALAGLPHTYPDVLPKACIPCSASLLNADTGFLLANL